MVLSSPIILYDYPASRPRARATLYDSTEIDEILALRVLTLTDEEKAEARGNDLRAAAIVDRCDAMDPAAFAQLHGTMREYSFGQGLSGRPESGESGVPDADDAPPWWDPGSTAPLIPTSTRCGSTAWTYARARRYDCIRADATDAHDMFLAGLTATVAAVSHDVDGNDHVAVTLDDDPASEMFEWQKRYLYFAPDELEPLRDAEAAS